MKTPLLFLFLLAAPTRATPTLYLIRHGEKPPHGNGLSAQGLQRAQCLRTVFGSGSGFNIGYIIVQRPGRGIYLPYTNRSILLRFSSIMIGFVRW